MATLISFHAHPDDEAILCGGTLALAARSGHRVVVVCATDTAAAATGLARILTEENAEVLTIYDTHGTYGHPDHIQVPFR
jgi:LmbE family N-acetylglucosaminyl deacetylase